MKTINKSPHISGLFYKYMEIMTTNQTKAWTMEHNMTIMLGIIFLGNKINKMITWTFSEEIRVGLGVTKKKKHINQGFLKIAKWVKYKIYKNMRA